MEITVEHTISMGHRLPSYKGICSSPHGHNVRVEVVLTVIDFCDFKEVSDSLRGILEPLDHAMVLHHEDRLYVYLFQLGFRVVALSVEPTTENIAQYVFNKMQEMYPRGEFCSRVSRVIVHETDKYSATATYQNALVRRV